MKSIETALIGNFSRGDDVIFGRRLLERALIVCQRAGIKRFFVETTPENRPQTLRALGSFRDRPEVTLVGSLGEALSGKSAIRAETPCVRLSGNLVMSQAQLLKLLGRQGQAHGEFTGLSSADDEHSGALVTGPAAALLGAIPGGTREIEPGTYLPFALNGRVEDRVEAELRLARSLARETEGTDGPLARLLDRRVSWRISYRLARTGITPNQVTLFNTAVGLLSAWLFALPSYGWRLAAAVLFLLSVTLDGVDGELARLKMVESEAGRRLDVFTDNVVHVAILSGLLVGCYRAGGTRAYLYLIGVLLAGFGLCAVVVERAHRVDGPQAEHWIQAVERATGRDFAYILFVLAVLNRLSYFVWGTALGTYVFAALLWWLTGRQRKKAGSVLSRA